MRLLFLIVTTFLIALTGTCQTPAHIDTAKADRFYAIGDSLLKKTTEYNTSIEMFENAATIYEEAELWSKNFNCLNRISHNFLRLGKYDDAMNEVDEVLLKISRKMKYPSIQEADAYNTKGILKMYENDYKIGLTYLQRSLNIRKEVLGASDASLAGVYNNIGVIFLETNDLDSALIYYKKGLSIIKKEDSESLPVAACYTNIAIIYSIKLSYDIAMSYYQKALKIYKGLLGDSHPHVGGVYFGIGNILSTIGALSSAKDYYEKDLIIQKKIFGEAHVNIGKGYSALAKVYAKGKKYQKAKEYSQKATTIFEKLIGPKSLEATTQNINTGNILLGLGKHQKAIDFHLKSIAILKTSFSNHHMFIATAYLALGQDYQSINDAEKSIESLQKSLIAFKKVFGKKSHKFSATYNHIAENYIIKQQPLTSLLYYQKSIIANLRYFENKNVYINPVLREYLDGISLLATLKGKALAFEQLYNKKHKISDLKFSLTTLQLCDSLINQISQSYLKYDDKVTLAEVTSEVYEKGLAISIRLKKLTNENYYNTSAFHFSEKSKTRIMAGAFSEHSAKSFGLVPDSLLKIEKNYRTDLLYYQSQLIDERSKKGNADAIKIERFQNKSFKLNRLHEQLVEQLEINYPQYYNLKYNAKIVTVKEAQQHILSYDQSLLEYFVGDSAIYTFTLTKDSLYVHKQLKPTDFDITVSSFQKAIIEKDFNAYTKTAHVLYKILVDPVKDRIAGNRLVIVPDGALWHINFDLLLTSKQSTEDYKELNYLLKEYAISYAYSANLLFQELNKPKEQITKQPLLAFSFSNSDNATGGEIALRTLRNSTTKDLPGSRAEVRAIADVFEGQYYYGKLANEANFKTNAKNYSILHLALHGEIDNTYPNNSKLYFTQNSDTIEDGYLYAYELYNMTLNADLAVLSACNTGAGKLVKGEGIMSLGRAFTYAGCKSLVLTQWEVSDATTPQIMKYFYQGLKDGLPKDEALRQAKLNYLATADNLSASPFYWGAFVLLGDSSAIDIDEDNNKVIYGAVILLLVVLTWLFFRSKRSKNSGRPRPLCSLLT